METPGKANGDCCRLAALSYWPSSAWELPVALVEISGGAGPAPCNEPGTLGVPVAQTSHHAAPQGLAKGSTGASGGPAVAQES